MEKGRGLFWFVYVCALGLGFSRTTASLTRMMGLSVTAYFLLTASLIIAVLLFIYLPAKLLAGKFGSGAKLHTDPEPMPHDEPRRLENHGITPGGCACLALLLGMLVCVRLFLMPVAGIRTGRGSVFEMNLIFQVSGSFFLYLGIFLLAGGVCAGASLLCVICLPVYHNSAYMAEPQSFLLCLFGFALWICALCVRQIEKRTDGRALSVLPGIIAGFVCGAASSAHLLLCSLFFLFGSKWFHFRKKSGFLRSFSIFLLASACSFFLIIYLAGLWKGQSFFDILQRWAVIGLFRDYDAILHSPTLLDWWLTIPVYLLAFLSVFGVLERERDAGTEWIMPVVFIITAEFLGDAPLQEQGLRFVLLGVMAGYGILRSVSVPAVDKERGIGLVENEGEALKEASGMPNDAVWQAGPAVCGGMKMAEREEPKKMESVDGEGAKCGKQKPGPGTWLENPLPVPKRHVKRELEYGFEPDPDQMFFDIPVSDLDDFDI